MTFEDRLFTKINAVLERQEIWPEAPSVAWGLALIEKTNDDN
jgi:hypothetical protein